jgi:hypothetical protein
MKNHDSTDMGNESAPKSDCKVIRLKGIGKCEKRDQPPFDVPLMFTLTPKQISDTILYYCNSFTTSTESLISPGLIDKQIKAEKDENYCWLVFMSWMETNENEPEESCLCTNLILEIKIGHVYLIADFGSTYKAYYRTIDEGDWRRGETAFIKAAALIGVRAEYELTIATN